MVYLRHRWELQHEFDTALWSPTNDVLTTANVGEVLPNIQCPLHVSGSQLHLGSLIIDWETLEKDHIGEYSLAAEGCNTHRCWMQLKHASHKNQVHKICRLVKVLKLLFVDSKSLLDRGKVLVDKCDCMQIDHQLQNPSDIFQCIVELCQIMHEAGFWLSLTEILDEFS
uniref:Uncharacterized protein n=1 Tax=Ditylenchus dipsaci TaxID=166011 RepID=A0A915D5Q6_9BILA